MQNSFNNCRCKVNCDELKQIVSLQRCLSKALWKILAVLNNVLDKVCIFEGEV